jgi:hypothetical protein
MKASEQRRLNYSVIIALCISALWMMSAGLPLAGHDDLFWIGPAVGLLKSGELKNPYLLSWVQDFGTDYFFVQGPVYFYALAGWLFCFGMSTLSVVAVHWLFNIIAVAGMILFFRRVTVPL